MTNYSASHNISDRISARIAELEHRQTIAFDEEDQGALDALKWVQEDLSAGPESTVLADPFSPSPRPLGDDVTIRFILNAEERRYIDVRHEGDALYVAAGNTLLSVHPHSSNTVHLRAER